MLTAEYDYETDIEVQREEAYEEGKREFIKNMYEENYSISEIAKVVKMPEEKIKKIIDANDK